MRASIAIGALCVMTSTAAAQLELKNDGFVDMQAVAFHAGFCPTEIAASRFVAPDVGRQLQHVRFLFGPDDATSRMITLKVWDDTAGTSSPGTELYSNDFSLTGSSSAFFEADVTADNVFLPQQFRVGIVFQHGGAPGVAADLNGVTGSLNYLYYASTGAGPPICNATGDSWARSNQLGVTGDWIIRAIVNGTGPAPDASPGSPDAAPGTTPDGAPSGGACNGNSECPVGEYCDTANHACTFDCREDTDCSGGGNTCNSLGQCIEGGGGGGCQADGGGAGGGVLLLAFGVLTLGLRRRRR